MTNGEKAYWLWGAFLTVAAPLIISFVIIVLIFQQYG